MTSTGLQLDAVGCGTPVPHWVKPAHEDLAPDELFLLGIPWKVRAIMLRSAPPSPEYFAAKFLGITNGIPVAVRYAYSSSPFPIRMRSIPPAPPLSKKSICLRTLFNIGTPIFSAPALDDSAAAFRTDDHVTGLDLSRCGPFCVLVSFERWESAWRSSTRAKYEKCLSDGICVQMNPEGEQPRLEVVTDSRNDSWICEHKVPFKDKCVDCGEPPATRKPKRIPDDFVLLAPGEPDPQKKFLGGKQTTCQLWDALEDAELAGRPLDIRTIHLYLDGQLQENGWNLEEARRKAEQEYYAGIEIIGLGRKPGKLEKEYKARYGHYVESGPYATSSEQVRHPGQQRTVVFSQMNEWEREKIAAVNFFPPSVGTEISGVKWARSLSRIEKKLMRVYRKACAEFEVMMQAAALQRRSSLDKDKPTGSSVARKSRAAVPRTPTQAYLATKMGISVDAVNRLVKKLRRKFPGGKGLILPVVCAKT